MAIHGMPLLFLHVGRVGNPTYMITVFSAISRAKLPNRGGRSRHACSEHDGNDSGRHHSHRQRILLREAPRVNSIRRHRIAGASALPSCGAATAASIVGPKLDWRNWTIHGTMKPLLNRRIAMDTLKTILDRRSIRRYKDQAMPEEDLKQILEAGRQAPSAANRQPCKRCAWPRLATARPGWPTRPISSSRWVCPR